MKTEDLQNGCIITFNDNDVTLELVRDTLAQSSIYGLGEKIEITAHPTIRQAVVVKCRPELQPILQMLANNVVREYVRWMVQQHRNFMSHYRPFPDSRQSPARVFLPEQLKLTA